MKKKCVEIKPFYSISARREITVEPDWWKKLGEASRKNYLKKHPTSQMAKFIKKQEEKKRKARLKKAENKKSELPKVNHVDPVVEVKPEKVETKNAGKNFAERVNTRLKDFFSNKKQRIKDYTSVQLKAVGEKITRQEIKRRAAEKLPYIKETLMESQKKFMSSINSVGSYIDNSLSPVKKQNLGEWLKSRLTGKGSNEAGEKTGSLIAVNIITAALGLGALIAVTSGVAPLAGALAGAFFGFNDYRRSLPDKVVEETKKRRSKKKPVQDLKDESAKDLYKEEPEAVNQEPETLDQASKEIDLAVADVEKAMETSDDVVEKASELESKSNDEQEIVDNPVRYLTEEIALWLKDQDQDLIANKIAELAAIEEMINEGYSPNVSDLSDEEIDKLLNSDVEIISNHLQSLSEEKEDYESEYVPDATVKKLTLRCDKQCIRLPLNERWRYNIRYGDSIIGNIRCIVKNTGGKFSRNWICVLEDGFNESVYRSGKPILNNEPYTLIKNGKIYLVNPIKQTFDETWSWAKLNIDKDFL
jgi:hypothetical protein